MTPLQKIVGVPLPSGEWYATYSRWSFDAACQAVLYEHGEKIVCVAPSGKSIWYSTLDLSPYRVRQARAWAKAVKRAMEGEG